LSKSFFRSKVFYLLLVSISLGTFSGCGGRVDNSVLSSKTLQSLQSSTQRAFTEQVQKAVAAAEEVSSEAEDTDTNSAPSSSATARALTSSTLQSATSSVIHYVILTWTQNPSVMGYNVYRATSSAGPFKKVNSVLEVGTVFSDMAVLAGTKYYYQVTAVNAQAESPRSTTVSVTIPKP
jgi:fibronectin type 3 domain-containing protein